MSSVTVWQQIPVVVVICFLVMITFPDGEWHGFLSEMVQQSKFHLSFWELIPWMWLSFFPWMSCIIFSQCDMLCLQHIFKNLTNSSHSQRPEPQWEDIANCSAALLYSPQYCTDAYKFGYLYSLVVVITGTTHFRNLHHFTSGKQGAYITDTLSLFCELQ